MLLTEAGANVIPVAAEGVGGDPRRSTMKPISFLTTAELAAGRCPDPAEQREHDLQLGVLGEACAARGLRLVPVGWEEGDEASSVSLSGARPGSSPVSPSGAAEDAVACVIGSAWNYAARPEAFLARLEREAAARPLFNPLEVVRWNLQKTYLRTLEACGVRTVPTRWLERADPAGIEAALDAFESDAVVVKPTVGQSSWRQVLHHRGDALPGPDALPPAAAMVQPYLPAIVAEGELSFVFLDGTLSHAVQKRPAEGDYRIQANFGGRDQPYEPTPSDLAEARTALAALPDALARDGLDVALPLLYLRVDMLRDRDGRLALIELEAIEPYLYPDRLTSTTSRLGERYAEALATRLAVS